MKRNVFVFCFILDLKPSNGTPLRVLVISVADYSFKLNKCNIVQTVFLVISTDFKLMINLKIRISPELLTHIPY